MKRMSIWLSACYCSSHIVVCKIFNDLSVIFVVKLLSKRKLKRSKEKYNRFLINTLKSVFKNKMIYKTIIFNKASLDPGAIDTQSK